MPLPERQDEFRCKIRNECKKKYILNYIKSQFDQWSCIQLTFNPLDSFLQPWDSELIPELEKKKKKCIHTVIQWCAWIKQCVEKCGMPILTILWNLSQYPPGPDQSRPADTWQKAFLLINDERYPKQHCYLFMHAFFFFFLPSQSLFALGYGTSDCSLQKHLTSASWLPPMAPKNRTWVYRVLLISKAWLKMLQYPLRSFKQILTCHQR